MWTRILLFVATLAVSAPGVSAQDSETAPGSNIQTETIDSDPASRLDSLFAALASASDAETAKAAENDIIAIWMSSGSDTVDLLMHWTLNAMDAEDYALALDFLDRIVTLQPDYAEGWNKRAAVHFLVEDYSKAIADIEQTLALEPRHFGAMSGLGKIMRDIGRNRQAAIAYRRALELDPFLDNVIKALEEIEKEEAGQET